MGLFGKKTELKSTTPKSKSKRCKVCKRMIRVRVMKKSSWDTGANAPNQAGSIKVKVVYSFYNHKYGDILCSSSHRKFIEMFDK